MKNAIATRLNTTTKEPSTRLCLVYEFKTSACVQASSSDHDAAAKQAARETGIVIESAVRARVVEYPDATLDKVHHMPFDPTFHVANGGPAVRFEFVYGHTKLLVRIVTSLGDGSQSVVDGVSASRLAFHTLELLDHQTMNLEQRWSPPPPLHFGRRQQWNNFWEMNVAMLLVLGAKIRLLFDALLEMIWGSLVPASFDKSIVNSPYTMFSFYQSDFKDCPAHIQAFSSLGFKDFLAATQCWSQKLGSTGYFYLLNFSPLVACGVTYNIYDIGNRLLRYRHAFIPAGAGPPPPAFGAILNAFFSRKIVVNNYGVHQHNFSHQPVAFVWDWLEIAAPLHACGCITINGEFLAFARGLPASLETAATIFGNPVRASSQNTQWFKQMGLWKPE